MEFEGREAMGDKDHCGMQIIPEAAEAALGPREDGGSGGTGVDERSRGTGAGQDGEVAGAGCGLEVPYGDGPGREGEELTGGGKRCGGEAEMAGEGVGAAHGDDAECGAAVRGVGDR